MAAGRSERARAIRGQRNLPAHVAGADLKGYSGRRALICYQLAQGVEFVFLQRMELARRAAGVDAGQADRQQDVELHAEKVEVDLVIRADRQQHCAPGTTQRRLRRCHALSPSR